MPSSKITSTSNSKVKDVLSLRESKDRKVKGLTIVEGRREIERALDGGTKFEEVYFCPEVIRDSRLRGRLEKQNVAMIEVSEQVYRKISYGEREEGYVAIVRPIEKKLSDLRLGKIPFIVVVETVEKPGNLGAILRTCDGAGVDGLILCDASTDMYNPNVIRASLGTIFTVPVVHSTNDEVIKFLKDKKIKAFAATLQGTTNYVKANFKEAAAIVLGSEESGLTDAWIKEAGAQLKIPMKGKADSLNVSTSAAILIYECLRQRSE